MAAVNGSTGLTIKCKKQEVEVKKLTFGGVRKLRDCVRHIDLSSVETMLGAKESKDLTAAQVGLRAVRTIGLDAPEIVLGLVQAFTDLKPDEVDNLEPAECLGISEHVPTIPIIIIRPPINCHAFHHLPVFSIVCTAFFRSSVVRGLATWELPPIFFLQSIQMALPSTREKSIVLGMLLLQISQKRMPSVSAMTGPSQRTTLGYIEVSHLSSRKSKKWKSPPSCSPTGRTRTRQRRP